MSFLEFFALFLGPFWLFCGAAAVWDFVWQRICDRWDRA